jgi:hypothetical protein
MRYSMPCFSFGKLRRQSFISIIWSGEVMTESAAMTALQHGSESRVKVIRTLNSVEMMVWSLHWSMYLPISLKLRLRFRSYIFSFQVWQLPNSIVSCSLSFCPKQACASSKSRMAGNSPGLQLFFTVAATGQNYGNNKWAMGLNKAVHISYKKRNRQYGKHLEDKTISQCD